MQADEHGERRRDWREVRKADEKTVDRADDQRPDEHQREPECNRGRRLAVVDEEGSDHDEEAGERPDRKVDAAQEDSDRLPEGDEAEGGGEQEDVGEVER